MRFRQLCSLYRLLLGTLRPTREVGSTDNMNWMATHAVPFFNVRVAGPVDAVYPCMSVAAAVAALEAASSAAAVKVSTLDEVMARLDDTSTWVPILEALGEVEELPADLEATGTAYCLGRVASASVAEAFWKTLETRRTGTKHVSSKYWKYQWRIQ